MFFIGASTNLRQKLLITRKYKNILLISDLREAYRTNTKLKIKKSRVLISVNVDFYLVIMLLRDSRLSQKPYLLL